MSLEVRAPAWLALGLLAVCLLAAAPACRPADDSPRGIFRQHCARCHGLDGTGNPRAKEKNPGLDLRKSEMLAEGDREGVRRLVIEGKGTMPSFEEKLTPEQIEAMVDLSFALAGIDLPSPAEIPVPPPSGPLDPDAPPPGAPQDGEDAGAATPAETPDPAAGTAPAGAGAPAAPD